MLAHGYAVAQMVDLIKAGLTATPHSLRHTHASTLIAAGLDVISRRLGHGLPAITLNVYGHCSRPTIAPPRSWKLR
jgi:integrase